MLCLVLGMRVSRWARWILRVGLVVALPGAGCSLNPQPLPPELAADSGSTSFGDDASVGGDGANTLDSGKGVDGSDASDGSTDAQDGGDAGDGAADAVEEGG